MRRLLAELSLFDDEEPHDAAYNMAADEALLSAAVAVRRPILRVYRWRRPAVSFGYFERWEPVREAYPERDAVRRWTGGGVVQHGEDLTYTLVIPREVPAAALPAAAAYEAIHGAVRAALEQAGYAAKLATAAGAAVSRACFENPVASDVLTGGRKAAGAAQRRTRLGLMHQGSVQIAGLPAKFGALLAETMAERVRREVFEVREAAERLAREKYANPAWLGKYR